MVEPLYHDATLGSGHLHCLPDCGLQICPPTVFNTTSAPPPQWLPPLPPIIGRHDYEIAIELLGSGTALLKDVVTHSFPLAQIQEALRTGAIKVQEVP